MPLSLPQLIELSLGNSSPYTLQLSPRGNYHCLNPDKSRWLVVFWGLNWRQKALVGSRNDKLKLGTLQFPDPWSSLGSYEQGKVSKSDGKVPGSSHVLVPTLPSTVTISKVTIILKTSPVTYGISMAWSHKTLISTKWLFLKAVFVLHVSLYR